ncbi:MAG: host attachment protein [Kofleriaceae bacterium]
MYRTCIVVVDASCARLFTYERSAEAEGLEEKFVEHRDFINPARRLTPSQQLSDGPGSSRMGGNHFGFDDHRDARTDSLDTEFARMVNREIAKLVLAFPTKNLILCASPRMLGHLRDSRSELPRDLSIEELARDLVKLTPTDLREHLAAHGLVPARTLHPRTA